MKNLTIILLFICGSAIAQQQGQVFKKFPQSPTERVFDNGTIEVTKSVYGLTFKDNSIPKAYKNAVKLFFKDNLNSIYEPMKNYKLKVAKKHGYIWVESVRTVRLKN